MEDEAVEPQGAAPEPVRAPTIAPPRADTRQPVGFRVRQAFAARLGVHGTYRFQKDDVIEVRRGRELADKGAPLEPIYK